MHSKQIILCEWNFDYVYSESMSKSVIEMNVSNNDLEWTDQTFKKNIHAA